MKKPISVVIFTKEPLTQDRVKAIQKVEKLEEISLVGVFIEDAMHLPLSKFLLRTFKRILKGNIYLPDFIINIVKFVLLNGGQTDTERLDDKISAKIFRVKNIESKNVRQGIKKLKADLGIIIGHRIISESVFSIPKIATINVHHGILPRFAGSHSTFWRMTEGHIDAGVTIHKVSKTVDDGDILFIKKFKLEGLSNREINLKILDIIPPALESSLKGLVDGSLQFRKQAKNERKYWKPPTFFERIKYRSYLEV